MADLKEMFNNRKDYMGKLLSKVDDLQQFGITFFKKRPGPAPTTNAAAQASLLQRGFLEDDLNKMKKMSSGTGDDPNYGS